MTGCGYRLEARRCLPCLDCKFNVNIFSGRTGFGREGRVKSNLGLAMETGAADAVTTSTENRNSPDLRYLAHVREDGQGRYLIHSGVPSPGSAFKAARVLA